MGGISTVWSRRSSIHRTVTPFFLQYFYILKIILLDGQTVASCYQKHLHAIGRKAARPFPGRGAT